MKYQEWHNKLLACLRENGWDVRKFFDASRLYMAVRGGIIVFFHIESDDFPLVPEQIELGKKLNRPCAQWIGYFAAHDLPIFPVSYQACHPRDWETIKGRIENKKLEILPTLPPKEIEKLYLGNPVPAEGEE